MSSDVETLPSGWALATINDTGEYINGFAFKPTHRTESGLPIIRIQNLTNESKPIHLTSFKIDEAYKVDNGSLLVSWSATLDVFIWRRGEALVNQHIFKVIPEASLINKNLLYHWLKIAIDELQKTEHLHGSTMKHINRGPFMAHKLPIPPENEQTRIVEKLEELLSDLDNGVAELKAAQKKLSQYRQSLLKSAVEGSLTEQWRITQRENELHGRTNIEGAGSTSATTETGAQLLQRILKERRQRWQDQKQADFNAKGKKPPKDWQLKYPEPVQPDTSALPQLPEGWVWASLDMLGDIVSGVTKGIKRKTPLEMFETPYLRVANVQRGYLDLTEIKTIPASRDDIEKYTLQKGDILFNEGGDRDKLGRGWVWYGEINGCIHQNHVFRMRPLIKEIIPEIISHYGNTFGKLWFQNAGKQTTNLASINKGILQSFPVPLSPLKEQYEILKRLSSEVDNVDGQIQAVEFSLKESEAQRKNILKDAFSGRLVEQNPNDEPASVLLEKIRAERAVQAKLPKPKRAKKKASNKAAIMETLLDVLNTQNGWVDAQAAFKACGVVDGTDTDRIEELYAELRKLEKAGRLDIKRQGDYDLIKLKSE